MQEQVTSEIRVHKAQDNHLRLLGHIYLVLFFDHKTQKETELGRILADGRFSPPNLKALIKDKEKLDDAVTTPVNVGLLSLATIPVEDVSAI